MTTFAERTARLLADAEHLAGDLREARQAAPAGGKAPYRYRLRHIEQAAALIARAVDGGKAAREAHAAELQSAIEAGE